MIHPSVRAQFVAFSSPLEGVIPWMYLDVKRLVTTAIGVLIDPLPLAVALPWRRSDGTRASPDEIRDDWQRVKGRPELAVQGAAAAGRVAQLRLSAADVEAVTLAKLDQMAAALVRDFPAFSSWPPDAQLATLSLVWAVGTALPSGWPRLTAALRAQDWDRAAVECLIRTDGNPGVAPRNHKNVALYRSAAAQVASPKDAPPQIAPEPPAEAPPTVPFVLDGEADPVPDTDPMTDQQRREALALVHATADQAARDALAEGYRRR